MRRLALAFLATVASCAAQYQYYFTDNLQSASSTSQHFRVNGDPGYTQDANGFRAWYNTSLISKDAVPDGSTSYEVAATLTLTQSGGYYSLYLEASPDANVAQYPTGTYYAFTIGDVNIVNGACSSATVWLDRVENGSDTLIDQTTIPCGTNYTYHAVSDPTDGYITFYVNGIRYLGYNDPSPLTGAPGLGGFNMTVGNTFTLAQLGPADRTGPSVIDAGTLELAAWPNHIDVRAGGVTDNANGIGLMGYVWQKDGSFDAFTTTPEWSDTSVSPGDQPQYSVHSVDFHGNPSSETGFTTVVPSGPNTNPRQLGVRPTGSYWGGLGEKIDMRSGNLNYSLPLVTLQSRGWSVPLSLSYNSQNWWIDPGTGYAWKGGDDIGYGFGWHLQAGSLTPYFDSYLDVSYYEFRDSSGASYRLDQSNNGVWTSKDSIYVTYDSNQQRLYFNNGSFWALGCLSAGNEVDAGTMYPTMMEDSNGNQISFTYAAGRGISWTNSSGRITKVSDGRAPSSGATYLFTYNSDAVPHLTAITNQIQSNDSFSLTYNATATLTDPITSQTGYWGSAQTLASMTNSQTNLTTSFSYDGSGSGELDKVTFPMAEPCVGSTVRKRMRSRRCGK